MTTQAKNHADDKSKSDGVVGDDGMVGDVDDYYLPSSSESSGDDGTFDGNESASMDHSQHKHNNSTRMLAMTIRR